MIAVGARPPIAGKQAYFAVGRCYAKNENPGIPPGFRLQQQAKQSIGHR